MSSVSALRVFPLHNPQNIPAVKHLFFADDGVYCCSYGLVGAIESTKSRNGKRRVVIVGM